MTEWRKMLPGTVLAVAVMTGAWADDGTIFGGDGGLKAKINSAAVVDRAPDGSPAIVWNKAERKAALILIPELKDWTAYDTLSFRVYSSRAGKDAFMLAINSDPAGQKGKGNYFSRMVKVDWTGWKTFEIPFSGFGVTRKPFGWKQIDNLTFNSFGWGLTPQPGMVLSLADLKLVKKN